MVELHLYQISKMFLLGLEDKEATQVVNLNIQRIIIIINFRSLIRNREFFKVSSRKWNIFQYNKKTWCYTSKSVAQLGSNISNTRESVSSDIQTQKW